METLYDWLLHNTGNAGNYYTILNTKHDTSGWLEIMARTTDFRIVNLFVQDLQTSGSADQKPGSLPTDLSAQYTFSDEQQVIAYLAEGKTPDAQGAESQGGLHLLVAEPQGESGSIIFPPA
ncbi:hypothetical protein [Spirosoma koreense]